ncbi:uncharacterized protein LOC101845736 [Aplysia californica]|uniref:Uncharacterized protein LOC101845736 n=1 Tax=Aplysia californica TaxID=6500 RepID=A0ABM0K8C9_APLCA|nr:uncharacterized protein LOC101845736 [Aplysia californica]
MSTFNLGYELLRSSTPHSRSDCVSVASDRMMPVSTMHRMALKACEKVILLMNNTRMLTRHHRLASMNDVLVYLTGHHEDEGLPGDRGDFYRRKLAEQLYVHYSLQNVDHSNVLSFVDGLLRLERDCRFVLSERGCRRSEAPPINVDGQILDMIGRLADVH